MLALAGSATALATGLGRGPGVPARAARGALRPFLWGLGGRPDGRGLGRRPAAAGARRGIGGGGGGRARCRACSSCWLAAGCSRGRDVARRPSSRRGGAPLAARLRGAARAQPARGLRDRHRVRVRHRGARAVRDPRDRAAEHPGGHERGDPDGGRGLRTRAAVLGGRAHERTAAGGRGGRLPRRRADRRAAAVLVRVRRRRDARARGRGARAAGVRPRRPGAGRGRVSGGAASCCCLLARL